MLKRSIFNFQFSNTQGFTLIELIVVFSVMAVLSTVGIASFVSYTNSQKLRNAVLDIKTSLQNARSQALSQTQNSACTGTIQGYEVRICCRSGGTSCPTCNSTGDYEIDATCSTIPNGVLVPGSSGILPSGVSISSSATTQRVFHFIPIVGGVTIGGNIGITGNGQTQTVKVTTTGVIQ